MKRTYAIGLVISLLILVAIVVTFQNVHISTYTNMSETKANAQVDRWLAEDVTACQNAGGDWVAGFSQAGCNVSYTEPDHSSWFVSPIENPSFNTWQNITFLLIVIG